MSARIFKPYVTPTIQPRLFEKMVEGGGLTRDGRGKLMSRLWTNTPPTESGFYWMRYVCNHVEIHIRPDHVGPCYEISVVYIDDIPPQCGSVIGDDCALTLENSPYVQYGPKLEPPSDDEPGGEKSR